MNAPTPQDIVALVRKIGAATRENRIGWNMTSQESVFQAEISENFIQVEQRYDDDGEDFYHVITIRNKSGRVLDQISSGSFYTALKTLSPVLSYPTDMDEIYKAARWQALGVGDVYKDLLNSL